MYIRVFWFECTKHGCGLIISKGHWDQKLIEWLHKLLTRSHDYRNGMVLIKNKFHKFFILLNLLLLFMLNFEGYFWKIHILLEANWHLQKYHQHQSRLAIILKLYFSFVSDTNFFFYLTPRIIFLFILVSITYI